MLANGGRFTFEPSAPHTHFWVLIILKYHTEVPRKSAPANGSSCVICQPPTPIWHQPSALLTSEQNGRRAPPPFSLSPHSLSLPSGTYDWGRILSGWMEAISDSDNYLDASRLRDVSVSGSLPVPPSRHPCVGDPMTTPTNLVDFAVPPS